MRLSCNMYYLKQKKLDNAKQQETDTVKVNPLFNTHWCTATLTRADQSQRSLTVLRDSGSLQSLISCDKLSAHDYVDTGESRLVKGVTGDVVRVPLVELIFNPSLVLINTFSVLSIVCLMIRSML